MIDGNIIKNRDDLIFIINLINEKFENFNNNINEKFKNLENKFKNLESKFENLENKFERFKTEVKTNIELLQAKKIYTEAHQGNVEVINPTSTLNNRAAIFEDEEPIPLFKNFQILKIDIELIFFKMVDDKYYL